MKAKVFVSLKPDVLDPQGKVVMQTLNNLGYNSVRQVRVSKMIEIELDTADREAARVELERAADKVLANPNTETFRIELED
ncbi:MAG: phosphoribosylformylglycinamidine synthase subunit PurS [Candidatus Cloacimonetes bacterium]|nr:phosphoribosylformylglycinamidine synthase subunit PurS [Candidatus Cloacimonadota bacterium]